MNSCILMAEIVQEPQLRYTNNDNMKAIAEMLVQFPGLRAEDPPATLKVVGWGNLAQEIEQNYHKGNRVIIEGRLSMNTFERQEGFKEKRAELTAQRIHRLDGEMSMGVSAASTPETSTPETSTPETSYAASASGGQSRTPETVEKKATAVGVSAKTEPAKPVTQAKSPLPTTEADIDDIPF